ncbi:hypothetical protein VSP9026_02536 [Vibrio spartinae]|uniref:Uncharacterized protein n=1 Tax=Vibrio spartinae TaxID=1918945 RepID=A0A1N6M637_9VIBR|nr:hypothetical protein VSP9026_02536 [Vibrio spartinae]
MADERLVVLEALFGLVRTEDGTVITGVIDCDDGIVLVKK